jgi:hypothetical protein
VRQPRAEFPPIEPVCGELLNLAKNTSAAQSCEPFT